MICGILAGRCISDELIARFGSDTDITIGDRASVDVKLEGAHSRAVHIVPKMNVFGALLKFSGFENIWTDLQSYQPLRG